MKHGRGGESLWMELRRFSQFGFSLIEFMAVALISLVLMAGSMIWMRSQTDPQLLEGSKISLAKKQQIIIDRLRTDLNNAVPVTGRMAFYTSANKPFYPGLMRIEFDGRAAGPRQASEKFDGVRILSNGGLGFRVNIDAQAIAIDKKIVARNPLKDRLIGSQANSLTQEEIFTRNSFRFIKSLIQNSDSKLIYTNNSQFSNVARLTGPIVNVASSLQDPDKEYEIPVDEQVAQVEYSADVTSLSPIFAIEWVVDNVEGAGRLIRRERQIDPDAENPILREETIAENLRVFRIDYAFSNRRPDRESAEESIDWPSPNQFFSHVRDPEYVSATPEANAQPFLSWDHTNVPRPGACTGENCCVNELSCVHWGDVHSLRLELQYGEALKLRNPRLVASSGNLAFDSADNELVWTDSLILFPAQYSVQGNVAESGALDTQTGNDCTQQIANRCGRNPNCQFEGDDPQYPDWKGYGDPNSYYCICGMGIDGDADDFLAPETLSGQAAIASLLTSSSGSFVDESGFYPNNTATALTSVNNATDQRLLACLSHFDATKAEGAWLASRHPLGALLNKQCLDSPDIIRRKATLEEMSNAAMRYPQWIYERNNFSIPGVSSSSTRGDGLEALKQAMEPPSSEGDMLGRGETVRNYISCTNFQVCDGPLREVLARYGSTPFRRSNITTTPASGNPTSAFLPKPFRNHCGCLRTDNVDAGDDDDDDDHGDNRRTYLNYDYNLRCNIDLRPINVTTSTNNPTANNSSPVSFFVRNNDQTQIVDRPFCRETWRWNEIQAQSRTFTSSNVSTSDDRITISTHLLETGSRVQLSGSPLPGGLSLGTFYFVRVISRSQFQLHTQASDAFSNTNRVNITSQASGTLTLANTSPTHISKIYRVYDGDDNQPQALNDWQEALTCECYARRFEQNPWMSAASPGSPTDYTPQELIPTLNGLAGRGDLVDLRLPEQPPQPQSFSFDPDDVDTDDDEIQIDALENQSFPNGTAIQFSSTGTPPRGLLPGVTYYLNREDTDEDDFTVHTATPVSGSNRVNIRGEGDGTHTLIIVPQVAAGTCGFQSGFVEGITTSDGFPFGLLYGNSQYPWAVQAQATQGFSGGSWSVSSASVGQDATRLASGNLGANRISVRIFDSSQDNLLTNTGGIDDQPESPLGFCSPVICPPGAAGASCRSQANRWYNDDGDDDEDEDEDDSNNDEPLARRYPMINRAPATQSPKMIPNYSSAIGACTDPRNTFAARRARGEITESQMQQGYQALRSVYNQNGTCGDRSSYCSPLCGEGLTDQQLVWLGVTQVRNVIEQKYNGNLSAATWDQVTSTVDQRTSNHSLCGQSASSNQERGFLLAQ
jgi:hypothetical protein